MAEVTIPIAVDLDLVKMKWRETYVSEGINRKVSPSQPPGIYQGLKIVQNIASPRQVELQPDPDTNYHIAVYETTDGFSLTFWDRLGTPIILDLSDPSLDNEETVIGLEMDYQIGVDTTASWKAFPIADWTALPASRKDEIVVLGTVNVPAPATNITTSMIEYQRTTYAWTNSAKGTLTWSPLVRNGSFQQGASGTEDAFAWRLSAAAGTGAGTVRVDASDPATGSRALEVECTSIGAFNVSAQQMIQVAVTPFQRIMVRFKKKNLIVPVSGDIDFEIAFASAAGTVTGTTITTVDTTVVDASYDEVFVFAEVPATRTEIAWIQFIGTPNYGSTGIGLLIDDVQVWLETEGTRTEQGIGISGDREVKGNVTIREPGTAFADEAIEIAYDEGTQYLTVTNKADDGNATLFHKGFLRANNIHSTGLISTDSNILVTGTSALRNQVTFGENLDSSDAGAETPNMIHTVVPGATAPRTVIEQAYGVSNRYQRMVSDFASTHSLMQNVQYDASAETFIKDNGGVEAMAYEWTRSRYVIKYREANADPADITTGFAEAGWRDCMQLRWVEATSRPEIEIYNGGVIQFPSNPSYPDGAAYEKNVLYPKSILKAYGSIKTGFGPFMVGGSANTMNFASLTQSGNRQVVTFDVPMDDDDYMVVCNGYDSIHGIFPYKFTTKIEFEAENLNGVIINLTSSSHVIDYVVFGNQV